MYKLKKRITFEAAHHLPEHKGKCKNLHGHSYIVEVEITAPTLNSEGMVCDFGDIKGIVMEWDHKYLNDLPEFCTGKAESLPTAENMARMICERILNLPRTEPWRVLVRLNETEDSCAEYFVEG
jgi:6-pyruvoyltetrahydropterin/6-carboxytetrahydropterin synthase